MFQTLVQAAGGRDEDHEVLFGRNGDGGGSGMRTSEEQHMVDVLVGTPERPD